ncbi:Cytosolic carboxypeptidase 1 [Symbiodinium microadriaticum]|uniref:Cytosolic carboxypeptidase 1 n=1 Tax=Symbiodinium microadriaticum TaxID=2951 RepID=A0A1Q9CSD4_SYMMI|nr:Cytosolic carboxypeptidase 1 [Symbiodinium microadriaticum]
MEPSSPRTVAATQLHRRISPDKWCVTYADLCHLRDEVKEAIHRGEITLHEGRPSELGPSFYVINDQYVKPVTFAAGKMSWALMRYVKPVTFAAGKMSWALMRNRNGLECHIFISHAWIEGVFEFIVKVLYSWPQGAQSAWMCTLSMPQHLDIKDLIKVPRTSPFAIALNAASHVLVVPNHHKSIYTRRNLIFISVAIPLGRMPKFEGRVAAGMLARFFPMFFTMFLASPLKCPFDALSVGDMTKEENESDDVDDEVEDETKELDKTMITDEVTMMMKVNQGLSIPALPMSDSGSESDGFAGSDDGCSGFRLGLGKKPRRREVGKAQNELGCSVPTRDLAEDLLEFTSCFESGNLRYVLFDKDAEEYLLFLDNVIRSRGHTQWFYFAVRNAKAGRLYRLRIVNMSKSKSLFRMGMRRSNTTQPSRSGGVVRIECTESLAWGPEFEGPLQHHPAFEDGPVAWSELSARKAWSSSKRSFEASLWDGVAGLWKPAGKDVRYYRTLALPGSASSQGLRGGHHTLAFDYVFESKNDCLFFAYYVPYTYSMLRLWPRGAAGAADYGGFVREARCDLLVISNPAVPKKMKKVVMVSSRVHPGESNASWLVHGLIGFLLSPSADAQVLRDNFVWMVVPMLNPDGVLSGNYRCGLCGMDLNRQWRSPHELLHAPVFKLKKLVAKSRSKLCTYLDLHGHSRKCGIFAYACGQFAEDDHRRFTVRMYPKLLSLMIPEFNMNSCRWTARSAAFYASLWGSVDVNAVEEEGSLGCGGEVAQAVQKAVAHATGDVGGPWPVLSPLQATGPSSSPCGSGSSTPSEAGSEDPDSLTDATLVDSTCGIAESSPSWIPGPPAQGKSFNLLDVSYADVLAEITSQGVAEVETDSDSGGSDSAPSADNLEASALQEVAESLAARRTASVAVKASSVLFAVTRALGEVFFTSTLTFCQLRQRATKASSKKDLMQTTTSGSRLRAKSLGTRRNEREKDEEYQKEREARSTPEEHQHPRNREAVQRVVAFGQTTYLAQPYAGGGMQPQGRSSPLARTMPRLEDRSDREPPTLIRERERFAMGLRCDRGLISPPPARGPHIRHAGSCVLQSRAEPAPQSSAEASPCNTTAASFVPFPKSPTQSSTGPRLADFLAPSFSSSLDRGLRPKTISGPGRPCSAGPRLSAEGRRNSEQNPGTLAIKWLTWKGLGKEGASEAPHVPRPTAAKKEGGETKEPKVESREPEESVGWSCEPEKLALSTLRSWTTAVAATAADLECSLSPRKDPDLRPYNSQCSLALRPKRPAKPC